MLNIKTLHRNISNYKVIILLLINKKNNINNKQNSIIKHLNSYKTFIKININCKMLIKFHKFLKQLFKKTNNYNNK